MRSGGAAARSEDTGELYALTELLGYPDVKNYDGSWTEYGSLVSVLVEMG